MIKHKPKCLLVDRALGVGWKASRPSPDHIPTYISETVTEEEQQAVGVFSHVLPLKELSQQSSLLLCVPSL